MGPYEVTTGLKIMRSSIRIKTVTPVSLREFTNVKKNLHILGELLTEKAVRVAGYMMADVLTTAQPQVPLQSDWQGHARSWGGKLRESGEARVMFGKNAPGRNFGGYGLNVAKGRRDGGVNIDLSKLRGRLNKSVKYITGNASYIRDNERGEDIALWTHEELHPFGGAPPRARFPGTGPKYLENAWNRRLSEYMSWIKGSYSDADITKLLRKHMKITEKGDRFKANIAIFQPSVLRAAEANEEAMFFRRGAKPTPQVIIDSMGEFEDSDPTNILTAGKTKPSRKEL